MKKKIIDSILISVLITAITAGVAMLFTDTQSQWYMALQKPSFQPPGWVFGVVWGIVYTLYAISLSFALIKCSQGKVLALYLLQAVLNILWCLVFFTLHMLFSGLAVILAYLVVTYLTARSVWDCSKTAAYLLIPQGIWLIVATALNYSLILLN